MPTNKKLFRNANKFRKRLFNLEEQARKEIARAYFASLATVLNDINKLDRQIVRMIENGESDTQIYAEIKAWYESRANEIEQKIIDFGGNAREIIEIKQKEAAKIGNLYAKDNIKASLGTVPNDYNLQIISLDDGAMERFVGFSSNGTPLSDLFDKIAIDYGVSIRDTISTGILLGQNPRKIARQIRIDTGMPMHRAETIARTESQRAARASTIDNYSKNTELINGYIRLATADSRTCAACFALHGTTYKLNELMPSHPNCRCILVPQTKSWAEITGDPTIEDEFDKIESADELFGRLSEKDKLRVLGPSRYKLMIEQNLTLKDFMTINNNSQWGPTTAIKPIRDLR